MLNIDTIIESDKPAFPKKKHTEHFQNILDEIDEEIDNLEVETNICDVPSSIKQSVLSRFHEVMDKHLEDIRPRLKALLQSWDTENYLLLFSQSVENATIEFGKLENEEAKKISGRSTINVKNVKQDNKMIYNHTTKEIESKANKNEKMVLKQLRRLQHIKGCVNKIKHLEKDDIIRHNQLNIDIQDNINKMSLDHTPNDELKDLIQHLKDNRFSLKFQHMKIELHIERLEKKFKILKMSATNTTKTLSTTNLMRQIVINRFPKS